MQKIFAIVVLVFLSTTVQAQQLEAFIPSNASAVATIKGKNFIDLLSVSEFNQSASGKLFLKKLSEKAGKEYKDVNELGIMLEANAYYFYQSHDSIGYHSLLIPLSDASKFSQLCKQKNDSILKKSNYSMLSDSSMTLLWDSQKALIMIGNTQSFYFENDTIATRYNLSVDQGFNYPSAVPSDTLLEDSEIVEEDIYEEEIEEEEAIEPQEEVIIEEEAIVEAPEEYTEIPEEESYYDDTVGVYDGYSEDYNLDSYYDSYFNRQTLNQQKLDSMGRIWTAAYAERLFSSASQKSILSNPAYLSSIDPKAEASIWLDNPFFLSELYGSEVYNSISKFSLNNNFFNSMGNMNGHVYFEDDHFRISTNMNVKGDAAKSLKKIYSRKINRKFLKYVDSDKALGYLGYAINSEAYLKELPKILARTYSPLTFGLSADDRSIEIGAEFLSLMLDEKAMGKMIKGDALLVLNGISEKKVTYMDFEYDEEFNSTQVEKTKMESIPDYLFMLSSDDMELIEKLLNYGVSKNLLTEENGIYKMEALKETFNTYLLLKNGIVFVGSSYKDLYKIKQGTFKGDVSSSHRKMIRKNNFLAYLNPSKIFNSIPEKEKNMFISKASFLDQMKEMGGIYMKSSGIKRNTISGEFVMESNKDSKNALKYLFSLIETVAK